jgi:catechol 2,3-dioxygenase-like lactoylglutathione lyase family enzyme
MMAATIDRVLFNILVKDLTTSAAFYRRLGNFEQIYTSDWFIVLSVPGHSGFQLGLIDHVSEFAPRHAWGSPAGGYVTLVVDDVFAALARAREMGVEIIEEPVALAYGQTRALIRDPNGLIVDLSTPTEALASRSDVELSPTAKQSAIDQQQPEEDR